MENIKSNPKALRLFYFWSGVVATLAYRAVIVLNFYSSTWVKISWYIGTIGFMIYFIHRFVISQKRSKLIIKHQLREKLATNTLADLSSDDKQALAYVLGTLISSKEKWNYYIIFVSSALALVAGIIFDFFIKI